MTASVLGSSPAAPEHTKGREVIPALGRPRGRLHLVFVLVGAPDQVDLVVAVRGAVVVLVAAVAVAAWASGP